MGRYHAIHSVYKHSRYVFLALDHSISRSIIVLASDTLRRLCLYRTRRRDDACNIVGNVVSNLHIYRHWSFTLCTKYIVLYMYPSVSPSFSPTHPHPSPNRSVPAALFYRPSVHVVPSLALHSLVPVQLHNATRYAIHTCICIYIHAYKCTQMYVSLYTCVDIYMHEYMRVRI